MSPSNNVRTRTVAYLPVSLEKQAERGVSLDAQRAKVNAYAALFDLDLVTIEVDAGESAKSLNRPALSRALAMLRDGQADALLVVKLDRLTRSVRDLCTLVERYFTKRAALLSVSEQIDTRTASGRMVVQMLTVIAEWERGTIGERTAVAMQHLAAQGKFCGGATAPYGYAIASDGETLIEVAAEQAVVARARTLRAAGISLRTIAATLDEAGHRARSGRPFAAVQVARMLDA